jgi:hypothetical protein
MALPIFVRRSIMLNVNKGTAMKVSKKRRDRTRSFACSPRVSDDCFLEWRPAKESAMLALKFVPALSRE